MKFNKVFILSFILLAILIIGAANAAENTTDGLQQTDSNEVSIDDDMEIPTETPQDDDYLANETSTLSNEVNQSEIASEINITFEKQMWRYNLSDVKVDLPESASGVFSLKIGHETIYNETITNKSFSIPIKMPDYQYPIFINRWPSSDYNAYQVTAYYNGIEVFANPIHFMLNAPDSYNILTVPPEILQNAINHLMSIQLPYSANGIVKVYVDGKLINHTNATGYWFNYDINEVISLPLGNHTMCVQYSNDTYYAPKNVTTNFDVVNVLIDIPDTIYINHDSCVTVTVLNTTSGTVYVYLDGKFVYKSKVDKHGEFLLSLEDYLRCNSSEVTVAFMGTEYCRVLTKDVNITYDFGIEYMRPVFEVGEENIIDLWFPDNFNNSLVTVTVDGVNYPFVHPDYMMNNWVEVDVSKVGVGNHTLVVSYPGDDLFAPRSESLNFTVIYAINGPDWVIEFKDSSAFHITLPSDADGNLSVYIDGKLYKTSRLADGKAVIKVDDLAPGEYIFVAEYTGDDYDVDNITRFCEIGPRIALNQYFTVGSNEYMIFEVPQSCSGNITVEIGDRIFKRTVVNGVVKISLKDFKVGEYDVDTSYSIDGYEGVAWDYFTVVKPKIQIKSINLYTSGVYASVKILDARGKAMANQLVTLNIAGKTVKTRTGSNGIASFKVSAKLLAKKYKVYVSCNGAKVSKTLLAKKVVALKTVKIKASAKSLILTATLKEGKNPIKSKVVVFKFNGKTYKAKTASNGIAKVTISKNILKNLKVGKRVTYQATYLKDIVKKSGFVSK